MTNEARLARFPRASLGHWPTPLQRADRLHAAVGGPSVWIKRDDCTGLAFGGNKTRKLEFLLGRALAEGADTVVTVGALQSNHARQTAAACAHLGLRCELVLCRLVDRRDEHYLRSGNRLLDDLLGATVHVVDTPDEQAAVVQRLADEARADGRHLFSIPGGGSDATGLLGYVAAARELVEQAAASGVDLDRVVVAASTAGTAAGLILGAELLVAEGRHAPHVDVACVLAPVDATVGVLAPLLAAGAELLGIDTPSPAGWSITDRTLGAGYGIPGDGTLAAVSLMARTEGVLLDPVYTGKAFEHLLRAIRDEELDPLAAVAFVHTGGAPGLFAYTPAFTAP